MLLVATGRIDCILKGLNTDFVRSLTININVIYAFAINRKIFVQQFCSESAFRLKLLFHPHRCGQPNVITKHSDQTN